MKKEKISKPTRLQYIPVLVYTFCRYWIALVIASYGGAKIFKAQFSVPLLILDTPLGEVSGLQLTWAFFGASYEYSLFVAMVQISSAILLLYRKTALLGALLLLPVLVNIILIDLFYEIWFAATLNAIILFMMTILIVGSHRATILLFLTKMQEAVFVPLLSKSKWVAGLKFILRTATLILPILFSFIIRFYNNIAPTSIDGKWRVERMDFFDEETSSNLSEIEMIYFEPNFAYRCGIRENGKVESASFFVEEARQRVEIRSREGEGFPIFVGTFSLMENDSNLILKGRWKQDSVLLDLWRAPEKK